TPLQQLTPEVLAKDVHLFENRIGTRWRGISRGATRGHMLFMGRNPLTIEQRPPGNSPQELQNNAAIDFYLKEAPRSAVRIEVAELQGAGRKFTTEIREAKAGINRFFWNMRFNPPVATNADEGDERGF